MFPFSLSLFPLFLYLSLSFLSLLLSFLSLFFSPWYFPFSSIFSFSNLFLRLFLLSINLCTLSLSLPLSLSLSAFLLSLSLFFLFLSFLFLSLFLFLFLFLPPLSLSFFLPSFNTLYRETISPYNFTSFYFSLPLRLITPTFIRYNVGARKRGIFFPSFLKPHFFFFFIFFFFFLKFSLRLLFFLSSHEISVLIWTPFRNERVCIHLPATPLTFDLMGKMIKYLNELEVKWNEMKQSMRTMNHRVNLRTISCRIKGSFLSSI